MSRHQRGECEGWFGSAPGEGSLLGAGEESLTSLHLKHLHYITAMLHAQGEHTIPQSKQPALP